MKDSYIHILKENVVPVLKNHCRIFMRTEDIFLCHKFVLFAIIETILDVKFSHLLNTITYRIISSNLLIV